MANRRFQNVRAVEREVKILATTITAVNTATPVATPSLGIASVAQAGGDVTVTLDDKYNQLLAAQATLGGTGSISSPVKIKSSDVSGAKTVVVDTSGSLGASDSIHLTLFLKNTSVAR